MIKSVKMEGRESGLHHKHCLLIGAVNLHRDSRLMSNQPLIQLMSGAVRNSSVCHVIHDNSKCADKMVAIIAAFKLLDFKSILVTVDKISSPFPQGLSNSLSILGLWATWTHTG